MKNKLNVALNALCVVLFNIVYFASNKYPMHILESGSPLSVLYIGLNVICSAFFFYMLTVALTHTEKGCAGSIFENNISVRSRAFILKSVSYLAVMLCIDGALLLFGKLDFASLLILADLLNILRLSFACLLITFDKKHLKSVFAFIGAAVVLFAANAALDMYLSADVTELLVSYTESSPFVKAAMANSKHLFGIKALIFESVALAVLIYVRNRKAPTDDGERREFTSRVIAKTYLRASLCVGIAVILSVSAPVIWQESALIPIPETSDGTRTTYDVFPELKVHTTSKALSRNSIGADNTEIVYSEYTVAVVGDDLTETTVAFPFVFTKSLDYEPDRDITGIERLTICNYGDIPACLCMGRIVCYRENGKLTAIKATDINSMPYNEILVGICERLIEDGNIGFFGYCAEYLYRHDASFLMPYIQRYSEGAFTEKEAQWMNNASYRKSYVTDIARELEDK
ncbi:MAG: hypothetical protein IJF74_07570 [Clostridia bacterium]|nr:hypothetical protein [Clostridia bacterium]